MLSVRDIAVKSASNVRKFFKLCVARFDRESVASIHIRGRGIEIGALHNPLSIPELARVKYVDRMSKTDLRKEYPELSSKDLVNVNIIDDGEQLSTIKDSTLDFVIANQFIEHCQNPIGAIGNMLRVLKNKGILYLSMPDKRYSFDNNRQITSLAHLLRDYKEGPGCSKREHFEEWSRHFDKIKDDGEVERRVLHLMNATPSIHYHVWTQVEMIELILTLKKRLHFNFEVELMLKNMGEVIFILRKTIRARKGA